MRPVTVSAVCRRMRRRLERGNGDAALRGIAQFILDVLSHQASIGRVFSSRELDETCLAIGAALREVQIDSGTPRSDCVVFVATYLSPMGGHTRVLKDFLEAEQAKDVRILVSAVHHEFDPGKVSALFPAARVTFEVAEDRDFAARVRWLQRRLSEIRPRRTYMFIHHFDAVSVAAVQPDLVGDLIYYHNCDHSLALGVHIPHALHVDPHAKGYYNCREREGVTGNTLWPLTAPDQGHRIGRPFLPRSNLTTCSSGGSEKFDSRRLGGHVPYIYLYEEVVPYILKTTGGTHYHIGRLPKRILDTIRHGMDELGIEPDRFVHLEFVPSLWRAMIELEIDVYVSSFPLGGGRALTEAMGAGLPVLVHANYRSSFFTDAPEAYPGAPIWREPKELFAALGRCDRGMLEEHSRMARRQYEQCHSAEAFREARARTFANISIEPPRPVYLGNPLQSFLDENNPAFYHWIARKRIRRRQALSRFFLRLKRYLGLPAGEPRRFRTPLWTKDARRLETPVDRDLSREERNG